MFIRTKFLLNAVEDNTDFLFSLKVELRDKEIERLMLALDGGRSHEVISVESRSKSNEKLIAHLNLQVMD